MPRIENILEWNFRPSHFKYPAQHLLTQRTKGRISESISTLEVLIEKMPDGGDMPDKQSIEDVYILFINHYKTPRFSMSKRNTRLLIWALDYQTTNDDIILLSDKLVSAIYLINKNWRDSFIISLWHVLLKNWSDLLSHVTNRKLLTNLLKDKCERYNKSRSSILKVSENIDFFLSDYSPRMYATSLLDKKILLSDANELFNYKQRIITYDYFASVAYEYISLNENKNLASNFVKGIYHFLENHKTKKTTFLICAHIINNDVFKNAIDIVKNETVRLIGDPAVGHLWRNNDLNSDEQKEVGKARRKLSALLNKEFIEIFFKTLVEDERREEYWLRFIDEIHDIKFIGNRANYLNLKKIKSISEFVDHRYKVTSSSQSTCALIMSLKDFVFIEFSDTGALYIYKKQSFESKVNLNAVRSMQDLKMWSRNDYACRNSSRSGYVILYIEGRITHQGDWESRVDAWMRKYFYD